MASIAKLARSGLWLYLSNIVNNLSGFIYWMIISRLAGPSIVGTVSAIAGLSLLITGILSFGLNYGLQRFCGKSLGDKDRVSLSKYFWSTFTFMFATLSVASFLTYTLYIFGLAPHGFSKQMMLFSCIIIILNIGLCFDALVISLLRTDIRLYALLIGNIIKILTGSILVHIGWGWIGAIIGYICPNIIALLIESSFLLKRILTPPLFSKKALYEVLVAGIATWLPGVIALFGKWLGVLVIYGSSGAIETGYYYVASAIASVVIMIGSSLTTLLLPYLSSLKDYRKRTASKVLKISLAAVMPITVILILYPQIPLFLLGGKFYKASLTLAILLFSSLPTIINGIVLNLVYAYGKYRLVLFQGLASNIPRVLLYFLLTPKIGGIGAAIAFTIGSYVGFISSVVIANAIGFKLIWKDIFIVIGIPGIAGVIEFIFKFSWWLGSILIIVLVLIMYPKLNIITRNEARELSYALLGKEKTKKIYFMLAPILDLLFNE